MAYSYMIPSISSVPSGYDCTVVAPVDRLGPYLIRGRGRVRQTISVYSEGVKVLAHEEVHEYRDSKRMGQPTAPFVWRDGLGDAAGYLENSFQAADGEQIFLTNAVVPFYAIYNKPGKKSFFSDNAYLYASPPVIAQIAKYGQYIDGYPAVRVDRERDYGESIIFINPYHKPLKARILTSHGSSIAGVRVPPRSARMQSLEPLLPDGANSWCGQIQITATNRVIAFDVKHSLRDPQTISDHEHLDPYRGEPTHFPATQWLRLIAGRWMVRHGLR